MSIYTVIYVIMGQFKVFKHCYHDRCVLDTIISEAYFEKNHLQRSYIKKKTRILIKILR